MLIDFDPLKNQLNLAKHGLSLLKATELDWERAWLQLDIRRECRRYDEHEEAHPDSNAD
jgi:uncharacterized DUF497 family protein